MDNDTRKKVNKWFGALAGAYGIGPEVIERAQQFAATPKVEQILLKAWRAQSVFLQKINVRSVRQITGKKLGMSANQAIASNTDTSGAGSRSPKNILGLSVDEYKCEKTNYDTFIPYDDLDEWSEFSEFKKLLQECIDATIANNKLMIGWYGESYSKDSDIVANPMMQDVNIGWFEQVRINAPAQLLSEGANAGQIRFGPGGDYENLDHLIEDVKTGIPAHKRSDPNLRVLIGSDLVAAQRIDLYKGHGSQPTEKERVETPAVTSTFGSLKYEDADFFPGRGVLITNLKNLGMYTQKGSVRRTIKENPEKDRLENFLSMRDAFTVEDYEAIAGIDFKNVVLPDGAGGWA